MIKKAKEYAAIYCESENKKDAIFEAWVSMYREAGEIAETRYAVSDKAMLSIFRELNSKWNAYTRLINRATLHNGFALLLAKQLPEISTLIESEVIGNAPLV